MKTNTTHQQTAKNIALSPRHACSVGNTRGIAYLLILAGMLPSALADPLLPFAWQARVKVGPMAEQRKHVGWIRDKNGDFIDDAFDTLQAGERTTVIVQLSDCLPPAD